MRETLTVVQVEERSCMIRMHVDHRARSRWMWCAKNTVKRSVFLSSFGVAWVRDGRRVDHKLNASLCHLYAAHQAKQQA